MPRPSGPSAGPPQTLLIDDFSNIDAFTKEGNPYADQAGSPGWNQVPGAPSVEPGSVPLHTNALGLYTGWSDAASGVTFSEIGGAAVLTWQRAQQGSPASPASHQWVSSLAPGGKTFDASGFSHLALRVKGQLGGEELGVRLGGARRQSAVVRLSRYVTIRPQVQGMLGAGDWQVALIPLNDFGTDLHRVSAIVLEAGAPTADRPSDGIYLDDLLLVRDPAWRPTRASAARPSTGPVQLRQGRLFVDGRPQLIRGVGYSPTPVGQTPEFGEFHPFTPQNVQRDFALMQPVGINAVRTWGRFDYYATRGAGGLEHRIDNRALLDHGAHAFDIRVCAGYWIPYTVSFANEWALDRMAEDFRSYVERYRGDPGILMWVLGNENNLHNGYDWRWYRFADRLARIAHEVEGPGYRPVAIVEAASTRLGDAALAVDADLPHIDVIGVNLYLGKNWGAIDGFIEQLRRRTAKPLWIAEYGVDAWHTHNRHDPSDGVEAQPLQAEYDLKAWLGLVRHRTHGVIGATVMEYSDEWWKDHTVPSEEYGARVRVHDYGGWDDSLDEPDALPDQFKNEEWWGLVAVEPAAEPGQPDTVRPRQAFAELYAPAIGGRVTDARGQPVVDRRVVLQNGAGAIVAETTSDAHGLYVLPRLQPGAYRVGLDPGVQRAVTVTSDEPTAVVDLPL